MTRGPLPKPDDKRVRRNVYRPKLVLPADGYHGESPELPDPPPDGWHSQTVKWWECWRTSPQAAIFQATDWLHLQETAYLADKYYRGHVVVAAELRQRVAKLGATPEDRVRLRWEFGPRAEDQVDPAPVTNLSDARMARIQAAGDAS